MTTLLLALFGMGLRVESLMVVPRRNVQSHIRRRIIATVRCNSYQPQRPSNTSNDGNDDRDSSSSSSASRISDALERRVYASAQSNVDFQKVLNALDRTVMSPSSISSNSYDDDLLYDDERSNKQTTSPIVESGKIGLAAAVVAAAVSFIVFHNIYLSVLLMGFLFVAATMDDESISGALARILGRTTIQSVQASEPKLKALARAAVTGEAEVQALRKRLVLLEEEVQSLRIWKDQRLKIEAAAPYYSVDELKQCCRANGLAVGGTKSDLMMRLVEAQALRLE
jgi:hypothetical protein